MIYLILQNISVDFDLHYLNINILISVIDNKFMLFFRFFVVCGIVPLFFL